MPERIRTIMQRNERYGFTKTIDAVIQAYTTKDSRFCDPYRTESLLVLGNDVVATLPEGERRIPDHVCQLAEGIGDHIWREEVTSLWIH